MQRRKYYSSDKDKIIDSVAYLVLVIMIGYFFINPKGAVVVFVSIMAGIVLFLFIRKYLRKKHFDKVLADLKANNQEEYLRNFISRFGLEDGKNRGWVFRKHNFDWDRINDLKKFFKEKNIISNDKDIFSLLSFYIQEKEEYLTRESIRTESQLFSNLSGTDFEKLLYRLFEKMGYAVEHIGHTGDQGADLIISKNGEHILIQAKCYKNWGTGNEAVQQVVGAMKYYNCSRAMVVTTSYFTPAAIALAKANKTELISNEQLKELLLKYLGESWR